MKPSIFWNHPHFEWVRGASGLCSLCLSLEQSFGKVSQFGLTKAKSFFCKTMFVLNHKKSKENFGFDTKSSGTIFTEIVLYVCFDTFAVHLYSAYVKVDTCLKFKSTHYNPECKSAKKYRIFAIFVFRCFKPKIF